MTSCKCGEFPLSHNDVPLQMIAAGGMFHTEADCTPLLSAFPADLQKRLLDTLERGNTLAENIAEREQESVAAEKEASELHDKRRADAEALYTRGIVAAEGQTVQLKRIADVLESIIDKA